MTSVEPDKVKVNANGKKSPGRKRRAAGWTLLLLGLIVAGVRAASRWYGVRGRQPPVFYSVIGGRAQVELGGVGGEADWTFESYFGSKTMRWLMWYGFGRSNDGWRETERDYGVVRINKYRADNYTRTRVSVLFWPIPLLLWPPAVLALRSGILARRRANTNACAKCGYSLAGLGAESPCPECGKAKTG